MKKYYRAQEYAKLYHAQAGMTLIELTVVLLILIGLAGLMVPYVSGFIEKTHDSTTLTNLSTLDSAIPQYRLAKNTYPDGLESLLDTTAGTTYSKLFKTSLLKEQVVGANRLLSLTRAGISSVYPNDNTTKDATFKSTYDATGFAQTTKTTLTAASKLAFIGGADWGNTNVYIPEDAVPGVSPLAGTAGTTVNAHMAYTFGGNSSKYNTLCYDYVAFGIGQDSDLIGVSIQTAPVHFSANGDSNPVDKYSRYLAVFEVQKSTNTTDGCSDQIQPARFVGTAMNMDFAALIGTPSSQAWTSLRQK